ncbi:hypothetical protein LWI29_014357 [Acer saccharum]|uniref:Uncharacterized protein n=1 Tax=Acer saccharum TaxID=4024 RepID=A0AA39RH68_ACESA|nr:hypothetical protein LWI29_014357 [Acer saccharum]
MVTLTAMVPNLRPPHCTGEQRNHGQCIAPNKTQLAFLNLAIFFLAIGGGGIRPCSIPFAGYQFDSTTDKGKKDNSFFNWYYTSFAIVLLISSTLMTYVQTFNWAWGFTIPTICMVSGLISYSLPGLEFTSAIIEDANEISRADGCCKNPWRLCSIQQVDELKCLMNIVPIWESAIISFIPLAGISAFLSVQALRMDRHLGPNFEIPAASISVVTFTVMVIFLPIYDRFMVPALENITKQEGGGITLLQRIGLGNIFSVLALLVAGFVERKRKAFTILHAAPVSVMYNKQFPDRAHEKCR